MWAFLASPRRRRRALVAALLVAIAVTLALALQGSKKHVSQASSSTDTTPIQTPVDVQPKRAPLTRGTKRAVESVVRRFFLSAVLRRNIMASYELTTANLRGGETRRQWSTGEIPVSPYQANPATARVSAFTGSFENDVQLLVVLQPRAGRQDPPEAYDVEVRKLGRPGHRRWLVDYVLARQSVGAASASPPSKEPPDAGSGPHLSTRWLLAPLAILILIVLVPIALGIRDWVLGRRADRAYGKERRLPPLPTRRESE